MARSVGTTKKRRLFFARLIEKAYLCSMRIVIQRVTKASVSIGGSTKSAIGAGFLLLLGVCEDDTLDDVEWLVKKVVGLRVFDDENGVMNKSILDVGGKILSISQFTLYGDASHGYRPGFVDAMRGEETVNLYNSFNEALRSYNLKVETGVFGADMHITFTNMGPTTIILDSKNM
jgi:D-tyrosyl-tRNA(Tyr) deacylase